MKPLFKTIIALIMAFTASLTGYAESIIVGNAYNPKNDVFGTLEEINPNEYLGTIETKYWASLGIVYNGDYYGAQEYINLTPNEFYKTSVEFKNWKNWIQGYFQISGNGNEPLTLTIKAIYDPNTDTFTIIGVKDNDSGDNNGDSGNTGGGNGDGDDDGGNTGGGNTGSDFSSTFPKDMLEWTGNEYNPNSSDVIYYLGDNGSGASYPEDDRKVFLIGNGDFGVTLSGNRSDQMLLNHKTSFNGPREEGKIGAYQKLGTIGIHDNNNGKIANYLSCLDMSKGVVSTFALSDNSVASEYFVSNPDDVFAVNHTSEQPRNYKIFLGDGLQISIKDNKYLISSCELKPVTNTLATSWDTDGTVSVSGTEITITGATRLLVVTACASSYDIKASDFRSSTNLVTKACETVDKALAKGWEALYEAHVADHQKLYGASSLTFTDAAENNRPIDELVKAGRDGGLSQADWRLMETLLYNYGRYTLMGSSRQGNSLPSNLQGIWSSNPHWNTDIHADINIEMNYWPAEPTGLSSCHMPFLDYIMEMSKRPEWRNLAHKRAPEADESAWCLGNANDMYGNVEEYAGQYSEANAWFCNHLWQHYIYTLDNEYLSKAYPVMESACKFWEKRLIIGYSNVYPQIFPSGTLYLPESWSPENGWTNPNAAHGRQLVTDLFKNTIQAMKILGKSDYLATAKSILDNLDDGIHVTNGAIEEWVGTDPSNDNGHRHISHLVCLYPLGQVNPFDNPTELNACIRSLELRGDGDGGEQAGWVDAWRANCRARTLQPNRSNGYKGALENIQTAVTDKHIQLSLNNMTSSMHQIEGNAGFSSAMAEMLMQSYRATFDEAGNITGHLHILPALPEEWTDGVVTGLRGVGNFEVKIDWREGKAFEITVTSHSGRPFTIECDNIISFTQLKNGEIIKSPAQQRSDDKDKVFVEAHSAGDVFVFTRDDLTTSLNGIENSDNIDATPVYYNLQGIRIDNPTPGAIYIRKRGNITDKVIL